ncbi:DUF1643 domain-containing protein [Candidatus Pacearchaeota archaeon]|nr:DUF1643 domain-containing protein [Candidatus Pacearchaeota archaeon]
MKSGASFSHNRDYRYELWRQWDTNKGMVAFIGVNPSVADEDNDDPTIRRCINFAKDWGFGGIKMINLFAFRATDPGNMKKCNEPVGMHNNTTLVSIARSVNMVVCAWGANGSHLDRDKEVIKLLQHKVELFHLGFTKHGLPRHPLMLKKDVKPTLWEQSNNNNSACEIERVG